MPEHSVLTELLELRMHACSFMKLLFIANYVETITCATYGNFRNVIFNVWKRFSRVQQHFVDDRLPWISLLCAFKAWVQRLRAFNDIHCERKSMYDVTVQIAHAIESLVETFAQL